MNTSAGSESSFEEIMSGLGDEWSARFEADAAALNEVNGIEANHKLDPLDKVHPEQLEALSEHFAIGLLQSFLSTASDPDPVRCVELMIQSIKEHEVESSPIFSSSSDPSVRGAISQHLLDHLPAVLDRSIELGKQIYSNEEVEQFEASSLSQECLDDLMELEKSKKKTQTDFKSGLSGFRLG